MSENVGTFLDEYELQLPTETQQKLAKETAKEPFSQWWIVGDVFHFDNVGVTRSHEGVQYLCCSECELGPFGIKEGDRYLVALDRVKHLVKE
ncbi:unnamed protein product [Bursaphelenchus okinawaensis]|uniref:Uncharacterized protein n=1 Tax=Bursaphelenchus okinawaensis TaxID=465554 RepID=A0A811KUF5_9BILA|nr:unnamed protein product [Bursaphelenchus okinawaensis]CAG9110745.1 unnamed protein product [Bursaphelenchus okinawaensis]